MYYCVCDDIIILLTTHFFSLCMPLLFCTAEYAPRSLLQWALLTRRISDRCVVTKETYSFIIQAISMTYDDDGV